MPIAALTDAARRRAAAASPPIKARSDLLGLHPPRTIAAPAPARVPTAEPEQPAEPGGEQLHHHDESEHS